MVFSDLWAGQAVKTTLAPKFGGPAQRWDRAGLGKGGAGWNPGPPFRPRLAGRPVRPRGPPRRQGRWRAPLGLPLPRPRGKGGGRGGGVSGGKGGPGLEEGVHGLGPCTTPSLGCPPKGMLKLDHFSISFGDFSFFL
jgi:hypothetical protein